jgi:antitoxin component YwqK of YwqJK toxin-antitoxin module
MNVTITCLILMFSTLLVAQEYSIYEVKLSCGGAYFSETSATQPPLLVKKPWCKSGFVYSITSFGDSIVMPAYRNGKPFTGTIVDYDSAGLTKGRYDFVKGYLQQLEEYMHGELLLSLHFNNGIPHGMQQELYENGSLKRSCHYENGLPHGICHSYLEDGTLIGISTYRNGLLEGPYYHRYYSEESFSDFCYQKGFAVEGELVLTENTCQR